MKKAYAFIFDGYADWELGHVLAELRRIGEMEVVSVGFTADPVASMGGLVMQPHMALSDVDMDDIALFILPGGMLWENDYPADVIEPFLADLSTREIPTAGICAATTVMAKAGILKGRKHASNSLKYLHEKVSSGVDKDDYVDALATRDGHIITASGLGTVDFTMQILEALDISTPDMRDFWFRAFKHGEFPDDLG